MVFRDIENLKKVLYTVSSGHVEYEKGRKGGWAFLAEPFDYDGMDLDCLEPFQINEDILIYLIKKTEETTVNNVHLIYWNGNSNTSESEEDNQYGEVTEEGGQD